MGEHKIYCSCGRDSGELHKDYCQMLKPVSGVNGGVSGDSELSTLRDQVARLTEERDGLKQWCDHVCPRCHGVGEITVMSGQTPESFDMQNIACPDCVGPIVDRAEAAEKDRDRWKREHDDMLAISRDLIADLDTLRAENANLRAQVEAARGGGGECYKEGFKEGVVQFVAYLLDHCEGVEIQEEYLQIWGTEVIRASAAPQPPTPHLRTYEQGAEDMREKAAKAAAVMADESLRGEKIWIMADVADAIRALRIEGE